LSRELCRSCLNVIRKTTTLGNLLNSATQHNEQASLMYAKHCCSFTMLPMDYLLVGLVAFFVSIGSAIAGGGGGLVTTPLLLLLGFSPQVALASSKAAGLGINIGALSKFSREKGAINWRWASMLSVLAIVASALGTQIVFIFNEEVLETLIGLITVGLVPVLFFSRNIGLRTIVTSKRRQTLGTVFYFIIMVVLSGLGSGVGTLLMFVLMGMMGFDALSANATKRVTGLALVVVSFAIFAFSDFMDWRLAASMGTGMLFGGYIGANLAIKHGNVLIRRALLVASLCMGLGVLLR
jgi:uncharacterized membrane protein YfcA